MTQEDMTSTTTTSVPFKMGKWKASKTIVRESWGLLKQDKEIVWFPVLSALVSLAVFAIASLAFFVWGLGGNLANADTFGEGASDAIWYIAILIYYLIVFFIANFFQAAVFTVVHARMNGQNLSFGEGMSGATKNIGKIFVWSLISATVGMILNIIADKLKFLGKILAIILGAAWNILTYFSLPSLVIGQTSITGSFKESAALIRKTWGESAIVNFGVGLFFGILIILGFVICFGISIYAQTLAVYITMSAIFVVFVIILMLISSTLSSIFKLALYEYARTGKVPNGFSEGLIKNAITSKKK